MRGFHCQDFILDLDLRTYVMGIVNVTPDSFSDGGEAFKIENAISLSLKQVELGADIIDIGGESTRPGSEAVGIEEELKRVIPVIKEIRNQIDIPISIDTNKSMVADVALQNGANIVNDISGGNFDPHMSLIVQKHSAGVVLMHIKGTPKDMQNDLEYIDLIPQIKNYLRSAIDKFNKTGVANKHILVDPGIGFGKSLNQNLDLLRSLSHFKELASGVLVGPSRKSFLGNITGAPVSDRLPETIAVSSLCASLGADVIRVHDVREIVKGIKVSDRIISRSAVH